MKVNVTISVSDELAKRVDEYAKRNYVSKSAVYAQGANSILLQESLAVSLGQMALAFQKIAENNKIDKESAKQLEDFMTIANLLVRK